MLDVLPIETEYVARCGTPSDINEHLPALRAYASQVDHVTELGVDTSGNSTIALLAARPRKMISYDLQALEVGPIADLAWSAGVAWRFRRANVLEIELEPTDLLFIDTWHHYVQLKAEIELHSDRANRYLVMHDTEIFRTVGSGNVSGGLWQAIEECVATGQWRIAYSARFNNGLTVLHRVAPPVLRPVNTGIIEEARRLARREFAEYCP